MPINASMEAGVRTLDELLEDYNDEQLAVIHDFLRRSVAMTERETAGAQERPAR